MAIKSKKKQGAGQMASPADEPKRCDEVPTVAPFGHGQPPRGDLPPVCEGAPPREIRPFGSSR